MLFPSAQHVVQIAGNPAASHAAMDDVHGLEWAFGVAADLASLAGVSAARCVSVEDSHHGHSEGVSSASCFSTGCHQVHFDADLSERLDQRLGIGPAERVAQAKQLVDQASLWTQFGPGLSRKEGRVIRHHSTFGGPQERLGGRDGLPTRLHLASSLAPRGVRNSRTENDH